MKKVIFILTGLAFIFAGNLQLLAQKDVQKEVRSVSDFTIVDIGIAGEVYLSQGSAFKLELEGDAILLEEIETSVSGETLKIRYPQSFFQRNQSKVKVYITMPVIEGLNISGSARLNAETPVKASAIDFNISGSGRVKIANLQAETVNSRISGSGGIELGGSANIHEMKITISGSGSLNVLDLPAEKAFITISGSGSCRVKVTDYLEARISGSGVVYYSGKPQIEAKISGSGKVLQAK
jgi:carbon monoxide dehydrogenase subunit G